MAADVTVTADFEKTVGAPVTNRVFGLNLFQGFDPDLAGTPGNAAYRDGVAFMRPGIVRYHSWEMMNPSDERCGWLIDPEEDTVRWDAAKIADALTGAYEFGPEVMINIPSWPQYMSDDDGRLAPEYLEAWGEFCADLVRIVNVDLGKGVRLWELPNERDNESLYGEDGAALAELFLTAARAMKAVDPIIEVGGAAFTQPYIASIGEFLDEAGGELDFLSYHSYSTGDDAASAEEVWDAGQELGGATEYLKDRLAERGLSDVKTFHSEYNISYAPPDEKMNNDVGMIFDALAMVSMAKAGVTGAMAWNEADGWYGKLDGSSWARRPAANVYHLFNSYMTGDVAEASSSDPDVVPFAVRGEARHAIALVHRNSTETADLQLEVTWPPSGSGITVYRATSAGLAQNNLAPTELAGAFTLPPKSVTVIVAQAATPMGGTGGVGGLGAGAGPGVGGTPTGGSGGASSGGSATGGAMSGGAPNGVAGATSGAAGAGSVTPPTDDDTGCGCATAPRSGLPHLWLLLPALLLVRRRRSTHTGTFATP